MSLAALTAICVITLSVTAWAQPILTQTSRDTVLLLGGYAGQPNQIERVPFTQLGDAAYISNSQFMAPGVVHAGFSSTVGPHSIFTEFNGAATLDAGDVNLVSPELGRIFYDLTDGVTFQITEGAIFRLTLESNSTFTPPESNFQSAYYVTVSHPPQNGGYIGVPDANTSFDLSIIQLNQTVSAVILPGTYTFRFVAIAEHHGPLTNVNGESTFHASARFEIVSPCLGQVERPPDTFIPHRGMAIFNSGATYSPNSGQRQFQWEWRTVDGACEWQSITDPNQVCNAPNALAFRADGYLTTSLRMDFQNSHLSPEAVVEVRLWMSSPCGGVVSEPALLFFLTADMGMQGGQIGHDGIVDNNDFVVFINEFFDNHPAADLGRQGGLLGSDNLYGNDDFVVFLELFFTFRAT